MNGFGPNISLNSFSPIRPPGQGQGQEEQLQNYLDESHNPVEEVAKNIQKDQAAQNQPQTNANVNVSVQLNQSALNNPLANQAALNTTSSNQSNLDFKNNQNNQVQSTPQQHDFQGARDLPAYAGIANISLKSWIANHDNNKSFANLESGEKQLTTTLEGIKGFQKQTSQDSKDDSPSGRSGKGLRHAKKNKGLLVLSHIFSNIEHGSCENTELLVHINNFKKLGSNIGQAKDGEVSKEVKLVPPTPNELHKLEHFDPFQIKYLHQLLALPNEFPEFLRQFAYDRIELNTKEMVSFLRQRFNIVKEQIIGVDDVLVNSIEQFLPLLASSSNNNQLLLPLILLYYPLPIPYLNEDKNVFNWISKKTENSSKKLLATCDIYYFSVSVGRFLIKFELNENLDFSFNIQTSGDNQGIVSDLENAIAESLCLLEHKPNLAELNVMLTDEIYKATDINEELSIVSTGPLRLEIILATYAALLVLNKLNEGFEIESDNVIELSD